MITEITPHCKGKRKEKKSELELLKKENEELTKELELERLRADNERMRRELNELKYGKYGYYNPYQPGSTITLCKSDLFT